MTTAHGFTLLSETFVQEIEATAKIWQHNDTKSQVLSFTCTDENKVFGVSFRTPPADSTGLPHILEHSVLCGSEKYPVKEPFVELLKGSLQTFLNAFTYPDKTCYPVASCNIKDFRNLTDVYLDAVFFPRITEEIFQQEGWHLEAEDAQGPLTFKGVVYNEMKGVFSAPESVLSRYSLHALFPDNQYSLESGGDPTVIPSLTYQDFITFHQTYYHPSNARFFFWGDDDEQDRLAQLGSVLKRFTYKKIDSAITLQPKFSTPREVTVPFAAAPVEQGSTKGEKGMVALSWLLPEVADVTMCLAMQMLEHILLGMPASPLRRALFESGIGEDLAGGGLETDLIQMSFDIGLKGMEPTRANELTALIIHTLEELVEEGIPTEMLEAAVNSIEFNLREKNSGRFPIGLSIMLQSLTTWLHDGDPLAPLAFEAPLAEIKKHLAHKERFFEELITIWFLQNTHRITVILTPDTELSAKQEADEKAVLQKIADAMSAKEREDVVTNTARLLRLQATPDTQKDLATIPRLAVADLPLENMTIPSNHATKPLEFLFQPLPTSGIGYVNLVFDLGAVPEHLLPLVPLFGRALLEMGTKNRSFVELNMDIARHTGGMDSAPLFLSNAQDGSPIAKLILSGKASPDKLPQLFELFTEILTRPLFDQKDRFLSMVLEQKTRAEHSLIPTGHASVASRLRGSLTPAGWLKETTDGISGLFSLRNLINTLQNDWASVYADLELLAKTIINRNNLIINITALPEQERTLHQMSLALASALPEQNNEKADWKYTSNVGAEGLLVPAQVNYVGKGINLFQEGYAWHGSTAVVLQFLRTSYLWDAVRVQGGAYGCICSLDRFSGAFFMVSYRDPNVLPTLQVYDKTADFLCTHPFSKEEIQAAIVGTVGELDSHMLPEAKGIAAFTRFISNDTEEARQRLRNEVLATSEKDFRNFGKALQPFAQKGRICALGGSAVEKAALENKWQTLSLL